MPSKSFQSSSEIGHMIYERRHSLGLSVHEAANIAGINERTWRRYEYGDPILLDRFPGVVKALDYPDFLIITSDFWEKQRFIRKNSIFNCVEKQFGDAFALAFATGIELTLTLITSNLELLSSMPAGTHVGELKRLDINKTCDSFLSDYLNGKNLMNYDYNFVYKLYEEYIRIVDELRMATDEFQLTSMMQGAVMDIIRKEMLQLPIEILPLYPDYINNCIEDMKARSLT